MLTVLITRTKMKKLFHCKYKNVSKSLNIQNFPVFSLKNYPKLHLISWYNFSAKIQPASAKQLGMPKRGLLRLG